VRDKLPEYVLRFSGIFQLITSISSANCGWLSDCESDPLRASSSSVSLKLKPTMSWLNGRQWYNDGTMVSDGQRSRV